MKNPFIKFGIGVIAVIVFFATVSTTSAAGKKYALFVGINDYPGEDLDLRGAVNDSVALQALLESRFGFRKGNDSKLLTDSAATRANILMWIKTLGDKAKAGDLFVFQYSGHGSLVFDRESKVLDETKIVDMTFEQNGRKYRIGPDYFDSAIVPADGGVGTSWNSNFIIDDELYDMFAPMTNRGVTVVFISDSCHAGTVAKGGPKARFLMPKYYESNVQKFEDLKATAPQNQITIPNRVAKGPYLLLAAAQDNQFALDSDPSCTVCNGLFTANLLSILKTSKTSTTYKDVMELVADKVKTASGETQTPTIDQRFGAANQKLFAVKPKGK